MNSFHFSTSFRVKFKNNKTRFEILKINRIERDISHITLHSPKGGGGVGGVSQILVNRTMSLKKNTLNCHEGGGVKELKVRSAFF